MPTYEYECRSCGAGFDVFQSMSDDPLTVCPSCGHSVRRKINGGTGIIFKGSGFYKNDSRKSFSPKSESAGGKADSDGKASENGSHEGVAREGASAKPDAVGTSTSSASTAGEGAKKDAT